MNTTTKYALIHALMTGGQLGNWFQIVNAVEREDGTNKCFNVTGITFRGTTETLFMRTSD